MNTAADMHRLFIYKMFARVPGRPVLRCCCILTCLWFLPAGASLANDAASSDANSAPELLTADIDYRDGRLSVSAEDVSLVALVRAIADEVDFEVVGYGNLEGLTGSWSFSDLSLKQAMARLLRSTNSIVTYRDDSGGGEEAEISRIFLLGSGTDNFVASTSAIRLNTVGTGLEDQQRLDQAVEGDVDQRLAAIDRSEGLADASTVQDLAFALKHDPDPEVRSRAIGALESIGGALAVSALETGIGDEDESVRKRLMRAFGSLEDERIPMWLGQVLMSDPAEEVRLEAVEAVARQKGSIAQSFLELAADDNSSLVSEAAIRLSQ